MHIAKTEITVRKIIIIIEIILTYLTKLIGS